MEPQTPAKNGSSNGSVRTAELNNRKDPRSQKRKGFFNKARRARKIVNAAWQQGTLEKLCLAMSTLSVIVGIAEMVEHLHSAIGGNPMPYLLAHSILIYVAVLSALLIAVRRIGYLKHRLHAGLHQQKKRIMQLIKENLKMRATIFREFHLTAHITRDYIAYLISTGNSAAEAHFDAFSVGVLNAYCDKLAETMNELHNNKLSFRVSIKGIADNNMAYTLARDRGSRQRNDPAHDRTPQNIHANTDFLVFLDRENTVWACDDLIARAKTGNFKNSNPAWQKTYNAAMVVPIRKTLDSCTASRRSGFELVGFLSVDCAREDDSPHVFVSGSGSPDPSLRNLLLAYADVAFSILKRGQGSLTDTDESFQDDSNFPFIKRLNAVFVEGRALDILGNLHVGSQSDHDSENQSAVHRVPLIQDDPEI